MSEEEREIDAVEETADEPQSEPEVQETEQTEPESAQADETLTTEAPEKNAAWAAMRAENKRLKEALDASGVDAQYLEDLKSVTQSSPEYQPTQVSPDDDYDRVTGAVNQTSQVAASAYREVNNLKNTIREMEDKQAEIMYPELVSDPIFQQRVAERRYVLSVMGKSKSTSEIAREVKQEVEFYRGTASAQTQKQVLQRQQEKQQATAQPSTQTSGGRSTLTSDEVRYGVRKGSEAAGIKLAESITGDLFE